MNDERQPKAKGRQRRTPCVRVRRQIAENERRTAARSERLTTKNAMRRRQATESRKSTTIHSRERTKENAGYGAIASLLYPAFFVVHCSLLAFLAGEPFLVVRFRLTRLILPEGGSPDRRRPCHLCSPYQRHPAEASRASYPRQRRPVLAFQAVCRHRCPLAS